MIKADTPAPYPGCWAAYKEIIAALLRQRKEPTYFVKRQLPAGTQPAAATAGLVSAPAE
jgi:hypothetical protein